MDLSDDDIRRAEDAYSNEQAEEAYRQMNAGPPVPEESELAATDTQPVGPAPSRAVVWFQSAYGRVAVAATIVGETRKCYRVCWLDSTFNRKVGTEQMVPRESVSFIDMEKS